MTAGCLGVVVAVVSTWPLATRVTQAIPTAAQDCPPRQCADDLFLVWAVAEGGKRLYQHPLTLFDANIFHPFRHTLAFSESALSAGAIVAPIDFVTGNPILGHNVYYLATYALSVLGMFLLVREVTGEPVAGLVAGLVFGLAAERWSFRGHIGALGVQWVPFVLYGTLRSLVAPSLWRGAGLFAAVVADMHASAYHGLMLPFLVVPWALVLVGLGPYPFRRWLPTAGVVGAAMGLSLLLYLPYVAVRQELQFEPSVEFHTAGERYWGPFVSPLAYVGETVSANRRNPHASPLPAVLLVLAGVSLALRRKPLVPGPGGQGAHLVAAGAMLTVAIAASLGLPGPLHVLTRLPGMSSMRGMTRFTILAAFASALLGGIAVAAILRRVRDARVKAAVIVGLAAIVLVDSRTLTQPMTLTRITAPAEVDPVYQWLATTPPDTAVLEMPYGDWGDDAAYMIDSLYHGRRMMNGYSALTPRFLATLSGFPNELSIRTLQAAGVRWVLVHEDRMHDVPFGPFFLSRLHAHTELPAHIFGPVRVVGIPAPPPAPSAPPGRELDHAGWHAEARGEDASLAIDGDLATHWTARMSAPTALRVDLGAERRIVGVTIRLGPHFREYPPSYAVVASRDGVAWNVLGAEATTLPPFQSYRRDHLNVEVPLRVHPADARYVEIRVPAQEKSGVAWMHSFSLGTWGVHELVVYADDRGVEPPAAEPNPADEGGTETAGASGPGDGR